MENRSQECEECGPPLDSLHYPSLEVSEDTSSSSSEDSHSTILEQNHEETTDMNVTYTKKVDPDVSSDGSSSSSSESGSDSSSSDSSSDSSSSSSSSSDDDSSSLPSRDAGNKTEKRINDKENKLLPSIQPYATKMERFELFRTEQCYYLIGSDKASTAFRVIKMDRTLIEYPISVNGAKQSRFPMSSHFNGEVDPHHMHDQGMDESKKIRTLPEFCHEDPTIYSAEEIRNMLEMIRDGDQTNSTSSVAGGSTESKPSTLEPMVRAHGIVGFIRFLDCYYLTLITKKSKVGNLGGNIIYTIKETETIPIKPSDVIRSGSSVFEDAVNDPQSVFTRMWNSGKKSLNMGLTPREANEVRYQVIYQSLDLSKDFFFSYTYDLTKSLQSNMFSMSTKALPPPPYKNMYMWNFFQTRELEEVTGSMTSFNWILPIIHGAFIQKKLQDYGRTLNLTLLARRSRHFAGTRYRKRGVSDCGKVANDVEHEQILHDNSTIGEGVFSSFLQVRGSIPTYWAQESSLTLPKPPIIVTRTDNSYVATRLHFEDLFQRYGAPIVVVDLVKQSEKKEREVIVGNEYRHAIDYLNNQIDDQHKIRYCALDYSHISKHRSLNVSSSLRDVSTWAVNETGFFCSAPKWKIVEGGSVVPFDESHDIKSECEIKHHLGMPILPMEQEGVLRTNCIDCLDRTNVAQFSAGVEALGQQLVVMSIRSSPRLNPSSNIVKLLIDMYVDIGDHLALQYGGSEAHKKVQVQNTGTDSKGSDGLGKHKELLTSMKRYYSNVLTDSLKQDSMNLFLGHYIPSNNSVPLWDMEGDYYLHNYHVKSGLASMQAMKQNHPSMALLEEKVDISGDMVRSIQSPPLDKGLPQYTNRNFARRTKSGLKMLEVNKNKESARVQAIRKRCHNHNEALSVWWRNAIQKYIEQRCWMNLGGSSNSLMSKFERDHGAQNEIVQFDRYFARPYTRSLPPNTKSKEKKVVKEESKVLLQNRKKMSVVDIELMTDLEEKSDNNENQILLAQISKSEHYGKEATYLSNFLKCQKGNLIHIPSENEVNDVYQNYINPREEKNSMKDDTEKQYLKYLHDVNLASDDVDGILKLSQEAHVNSEIMYGPYRGLSQHESAIEVTTVIAEQYNAFDRFKQSHRNEKESPISSTMNEELKRRAMDTAGVIDAIDEGWKQYEQTERCYHDLTATSSLFHRRSDITDKASMALYCSFFEEDTKIKRDDAVNITGDVKLGPQLTKEVPDKFDVVNSRLMNKARTLGIQIQQGSVFSSNITPELFPRISVDKVPDGFEQIHENLYARKDNRFLVFNDVSLIDWPPKSKTKTTSIVNDMNMIRK